MPVDRTVSRRSPRRRPHILAVLSAACLALGLAGAHPLAAQPPQPSAGAPDAAPSTESRDGARSFDDPFDAYEARAWEEALKGFLDRRAKRPDDPAELLNVGSTHYQMGEYEEAVRAFRAAGGGEAGSTSTDIPTTLRQKALYNLGNTAYRQRRLEEAVEHYREALELDPEDQDAKINLELVQRELEQRQQQSQPQPQPDPNGQQDPQDQDSQNQESQNQQPQDPNDPQSQESSQGPQNQNQNQEQQPQSGPQEPDQDGDGLPDKLEREAENPTDPTNPDTDGDGLQDGAEDLDADGRVDPQETDPNRRDTDGDGTPDGEEIGNPPPGETGGVPGEPLEGLTEEEALRYLMALEESPPPHKPEGARTARAGRPAKDW